MPDVSASQLGRFFVGLVCAALVVAILYLARELLVPLALAAYFAFLLEPAVRRVERLRIGRAPSVLLVVGVGLSMLVGIGWLLAAQGRQVVAELPRYQSNIEAKATWLRSSLVSTSGSISRALSKLDGKPDKTSDSDLREPDSPIPPIRATSTDHGPTEPDDEKPVKVEVVSTQNSLVNILRSVLGPVVHPIATAGISLVLLIFLLVYREDIRDRVVRIGGVANIQLTTIALSDCATRVTRFLIAMVMANGLIGLVTGLGLYALGIPNAGLWGLIAAVFRFVPYVGTTLAALFPFALAVAIFEGWSMPALVLVWCILVDVISANFVEPLLYGARTGVAPTAILLAFLFWTWLWGGIGLFLATPITVCLAVLGKHLPSFNFLTILLSDEPVLEPQARFYQRLLAKDELEAHRIAKEFAKDTNLLESCNRIVVPTLAQLEFDRLCGLLDEDRISFVRGSIEKLMTWAKQQPNSDQDGQDGDSAPVRATFALAFDRGAFDSLLTPLLESTTPNRRLHWVAQGQENLVNETVAEALRAQPRGIVLAAIEPRDAGRLRILIKRLQAAGWDRPIHVAVFAASARAGATARRLSRDPALIVHPSLVQLVEGVLRSSNSTFVGVSDSDPSKCDEQVPATHSLSGYMAIQ